MLCSTLHTIFHHRFAVGFSAVALLGSGAALAAPGGPLQVQLAAEEDGVEAEADIVEEDDGEVSAVAEAEVVEEEPTEEVAPEDETDDEGTENATVEDEVDKDADEDDGLPPFCTGGPEGIPITPEARSQEIAEQARGGAASEAPGPPPSSNGNRDDDEDPEASEDVEELEQEDHEEDEPEGEAVEPADAPEDDRGGPPAHANARSNR